MLDIGGDRLVSKENTKLVWHTRKISAGITLLNFLIVEYIAFLTLRYVRSLMIPLQVHDPTCEQAKLNNLTDLKDLLICEPQN